jgi:hypothetical protein
MAAFMQSPTLSILRKKWKLLKRKNKIPITYINMVRFDLSLETTYKTDFIKKNTPVCPAKIFLESNGQGTFTSSKSNFNENADFKAMSPNFHAISTSKHSNIWVLHWSCITSIKQTFFIILS